MLFPSNKVKLNSLNVALFNLYKDVACLIHGVNLPLDIFSYPERLKWNRSCKELIITAYHHSTTLQRRCMKKQQMNIFNPRCFQNYDAEQVVPQIELFLTRGQEQRKCYHPELEWRHCRGFGGFFVVVKNKRR